MGGPGQLQWGVASVQGLSVTAHESIRLLCSWSGHTVLEVVLGNMFSFSSVDGSSLLLQIFSKEYTEWEEFILLQMARALYVSGSFPWKD